MGASLPPPALTLFLLLQIIPNSLKKVSAGFPHVASEETRTESTLDRFKKPREHLR